MYVSAIVSSALPLWHWNGDCTATPVTLGSCLRPGGVMATPTFCHALPTARRLRRLDSLALCCDDVRSFSPEHGFCQIKFFRWSHLRTDAACAAEKRVCQRRWRLAFLGPLRSQACSEVRRRGCLVRALVDLRRQRGPWHSYGVSRNSVPPRPRRNGRPE